MNLVVDASVAVEYLLRTTVGIAIADRLEASELLAPELLDAEVLAVLRREVLAKRLSTARAAQAIGDLRDWPLERAPHRALLETAWSLRANVTAYDALYVAVARLRAAPLLTADGPLARASVPGVVIESVRAPA